MPKEITIILKGEDSTYKHKFLCYEPFDANFDKKLIEMVNEAKALYKGVVEDVKIKMSWEF